MLSEYLSGAARITFFLLYQENLTMVAKKGQFTAGEIGEVQLLWRNLGNQGNAGNYERGFVSIRSSERVSS